VVVRAGQVRVLGHVGSAPVQSLNSVATTQLFLQAARTSSLVTTRAVAGRVQRLGYLLSARSPAGVYVVGASQQLPTDRRTTLPAGSPNANLNFALYFGPSARPEALIETDVGRLPLTGTVAKATVPFGNNVLTLIGSPRAPLAGTWAEYLPWGILGLGILLSFAAAGATEYLVRRRKTAESMYQQQRRVSETLQQALLPKKLPTVPGWEFAARYVPATKGAEIGGDWYSVVEIDDHKFAFVIGDVSGHDIAAAGVMAALRYTIRTLATLGIPPEEVLYRTTTELDVSTDEHFATALVGVVDRRMEQMTLASAGHPPPLMLHEGRAEFLGLSPGVPLGVPGPRPEPTTIHFPRASTLIAFTDGLIERHGQSVDVGLDQLAATAADSPARPEDVIAHLVGTLTGSDQEDDIAILAIRLTAPDEKPEATDLSPSPSASIASGHSVSDHPST
jgi:serine phosphatase RsbU (regulator of sigma subunit)